MRNETIEVCHRFLDLLDRDLNRCKKVYEGDPNDFNKGILAEVKRIKSNLIVAEWCVNGNHELCWYEDETCLGK